MRKGLGLGLIALLLTGIAAGCGGSGSVSQKPWKAGEKTELLLATGGTGGTYYPLGGGMGKIWADNIKGLNVTVQSTAASVANIRLVAQKEADLAMIQNDTADYGRTGKEAFAEKNEKYTNYLAMGALYPEVVQIVVRADSNINSIDDLKGKKVVVGAAGSGTELASRQIFGAYGLSYKENKDMNALYISFAEGATAFKDKNADALVMVTAVPAASLADIQTATKVRLLPVDVTKLQKNYPFYVTHTIKAGTYSGHDKDADAVAVLAMLIVREDLHTDLVYEMTKSLFEKKGDIGHAKAKEFEVMKAADGVTIPFHPGALKYLKEKGVNVK
jgi:TRAP transporter TAXI family solute receptor